MSHHWTPCHVLPTLYREWYGLCFLAFFTLHVFYLLALSLPWDQQFSLKVSRAEADRRNIAPAQLLCRIAAIHSSYFSFYFLFSSLLVSIIQFLFQFLFYFNPQFIFQFLFKASFEVRIPQPQDLPFSGYKPARLPQPQNQPLTSFEPALLQVPCCWQLLCHICGQWIYQEALLN